MNYFNDKKNVDYLVNNPELILSDLSISKKQSKGILIDYKDVPINTDYIDILIDIGDLTILAKSKWLNCVYVEAEIDLITSLIDLNFVSSVEFANKSLNPNKNLRKNSDIYNKFKFLERVLLNMAQLETKLKC